MPVFRRRPRLAIARLEDRTVPSVVAAGFNDALGINADATPNSPYTLGAPFNGTGGSESGWAGNWVETTGAPALATIQTSNTFEGDGALHIGGGTVQVIRDVSNGITSGKITFSQMLFAPPAGGVGSYLQDSAFSDPAVSSAAVWTGGASSNFTVLDGGTWEDTGIPVPIQQWARVDVQVDMTARTWDFFVNGVKYNAPDPLNFRGTPSYINQLNYLVTNVPGVDIDAIQVSTSDISRGDQYSLPQGTQLVVNVGCFGERFDQSSRAAGDPGHAAELLHAV